VGVWSISDNGDLPAHWTIGGPKGVLRMPRGIALDVKNQNIMVSDKRLNAVLTFQFPEVFENANQFWRPAGGRGYRERR